MRHKQSAHIRRYRSGKRRLVNPNIIKRRNYGFIKPFANKHKGYDTYEGHKDYKGYKKYSGYKTYAQIEQDKIRAVDKEIKRRNDLMSNLGIDYYEMPVWNEDLVQDRKGVLSSLKKNYPKKYKEIKGGIVKLEK